ncbi:unnamed protein product [Polarella glacialis]|uniref:ADP,ATP carrier protein n=1 Tax=Polarella glacialis TaxID=89957 RepID=A0A813LA72_POLGL|nr:unnamed protein product [Polarella glacialis]
MTSPVDDIDVTPSFGSRLNMEEMSPEDKASKLPLPVLHLLKRPQASVLTNVVSGTIGSMLAEAVLFPLDTVKLQVQTASMDDSKGFLETTLHVVRTAGLSGLYKGLGGSMIKETIHSMNYWLFHGFLFSRFAKYDDTSKTSTMSRLLLNLLAKQLNWLCTVPFEVISTVNQLSATSPGFVGTALILYKEGGLGAFYRGLAVSMLLAINPAIMNTLITTILKLFAAVRQSWGADYLEARDHSIAAVGVATAFSKAVATALTYPLIRAKVLQQTGGPAMASLRFAVILRRVAAAEGLAGLYRGMLAMSYKTVLWNSLMMAFKHLLGPKRAVTPPSSPRFLAQISRRSWTRSFLICTVNALRRGAWTPWRRAWRRPLLKCGRSARCSLSWWPGRLRSARKKELRRPRSPRSGL